MFDWHGWLSANKSISGAKKRQKAERKGTKRATRLSVVQLEAREMMANDVPTITAVTPRPGSFSTVAPSQIRVTFSEPMNTATVENEANYLLIDQNGRPIVINDATLDPSGTQVTISFNNNVLLDAGSYTLFVMGDKVFDADDGFPLAQKADVIVANAGTNEVAVVTTSDNGLLGSLSNYVVPRVAGALRGAVPWDVRLADINGDGRRDLVVASGVSDQVTIFLGRPAAQGFGFNYTPDKVLALPVVPAGNIRTEKSLVVADFDLDGLADIAVASAGTNEIIYFQNVSQAGNPNFGPRQVYNAFNTPIAIHAADFDNDGHPDLAVANFNTANPVPPGGTNNSYIIQVFLFRPTTDDFNTFPNTNLWWVTGDQRTNNPQRGVFPPHHLGAGRIDGDNLSIGSIDIVMGVGSNLAYIVNQSGAGAPNFGRNGPIANAGAFTDVVNPNQKVIDGGYQVAGIATGDVDGDGRDDIVVSGVSGGNSFVRVYQNRTTPGVYDTFLRQTLTIPGVTFGGEIALADLNADGRLDIIVAAGQGESGVSVFLNGGNGAGGLTTFTPTAQSPLPAHEDTTALDVGDFDNDGSIDIVATNVPAGILPNGGTNDGVVSVLRGNPLRDGTFLTSVNTAVQAPVSGTASGDLNRDGIADIVVINRSQLTSNSFVSVMLGVGNGAYAAPVQFNPAYQTNPNDPASLEAMNDLVNVTLADVNDDGRLDILVVSRSQDAVGVLLNNIPTPTSPLVSGPPTTPNRSFINMPRVIVGDQPTDVEVANFDGDVTASGRRKFDLVVSHAGLGVTANRGVTYVRGNGDGTFQSTFRTEVPFVAGLSSPAVAVGDINRDGRPDLIVATDIAGGPSQVYYLANRPTAAGGVTWQLVNAYSMGVVNITDVLLTDFNNDNFLDVIVSSQSGGLNNGGVSVLMNQFGTGFANSLVTPVVPGIGLQKLAVIDLNRDGRKDVVVSAFNSQNKEDNFFSLIGRGDGTFFSPVPYNAIQRPIVGVPVTVPGYTDVTNDPVLKVTHFVVGGNRVTNNLINNGDFEQRDLPGEPSNLTSWQTYQLEVPTGSRGGWTRQTGSSSPQSASGVALPTDRYRAMLDQEHLRPFTPQVLNFAPTNPNLFDAETVKHSYGGTHALYQDVFIPASVQKMTLKMNLYLHTFAFIQETSSGWSNPSVNPTLNHNDPQNTQPNQQVRVDIISPTGAILGTSEAEGVLVSIFNTDPTVADETTVPINFTFSAAQLAALRGKTVRLRIASVNNRGQLIVGADDVDLTATYLDTALPTLSNVRLRNSGIFKNGVATTTDPTIIGRVGDGESLIGGNLNNLAYIEFDTEGNGFGGSDDFKINNWDAAGNFAFAPPNLRFGTRRVNVRVVDKANHFRIIDQPIVFQYQDRSVLDWQAVGPTAIDTTADNSVGFSNVSGRITATVVDPLDPSGNTYYVASANGGVWKTTNGGQSWIPTMDFLTDSQGRAIPAPIGGLAMHARKNANGTVVKTLYAGTGVGDANVGSRPGFGILRSDNEGATWRLVGDSPTVLAGARIVKMIVDPNDENIAYAAVSQGGRDGPGVYRTTNGGLNWVNVLRGDRMRINNNTTVFGTAATPLASVTDIVMDPFNSKRLLIGIGNVGLITDPAAAAAAGVWRTTSFGDGWDRIEGGDSGIPLSNLPFGAGVGRVTIAMASGRLGDTKNVYVLMGTPPGGITAGPTPPAINNGGFLGLFSSTNNMLNFTEVMMRSNRPVAGNIYNYLDIAVGYGESAYSAALTVDPNNPYIVYVGGARRYGPQHDRAGQPFFGMNHALIRVHVANMVYAGSRDVDGFFLFNATGGPVPQAFYGDDYYKFLEADTARANIHNRQRYYNDEVYEGEGVFWYDLETDLSGDQGFAPSRFPRAIHNLNFDNQGRMLIGTEGGLFRGINEGFGYDYSSDNVFGLSILIPYNGFFPTQNGFKLTELNGNLQIADLTSVDVDPRTNDTFYTTQLGTGTAVSTSLFNWASSGLVNPVDDSPHAANIRVATDAPLSFAPPGTPSTLFRNWEFANPSLLPEVSTDGGFVFDRINSGGIAVSGNNSRRLPVMVVNPRKIRELTGGQEFYVDQVLLGTNQVWATRSSATTWDPWAQFPGVNNGLITALSIGGVFSDPANPNLKHDVVFAGTDAGKFFVTLNSGGSWTDFTAGLPAGVRITAIFGDPDVPSTVYVAVSGRTGPRIFKSLNFGNGWASISGNGGGVLPNGEITSILLDNRKRPQDGVYWNPGAPNGKLYIGTDTGVYVTIDQLGWTKVGSAIPNVPIVDLQHEPKLNLLVAASQGRGAFALSTAPITALGDQVIDEDTVAGPLAFEVNTMGLDAAAVSVRVNSTNQTLVPDANIVLTRVGTTSAYTLTVRPAANRYGTARIIVTVTDKAGNTFVESFLLTVNSVNDAPVVLTPALPIADVQIPQNTSHTFRFKFTDPDTALTAMNLTVSSDNPVLLPNDATGNSIRVTKNAPGDYTIRLTPAADQVGVANVTIRVTDPNGPPFDVNNYKFALQVFGNAPLPFSDNFNRPNSTSIGPYWLETFGAIGLNGQRLQSFNRAGGLARLRGVSQANVDLTARVDLETTGTLTAGLVARYQGGAASADQNYFYGSITGVNGVYTVRIERNLNGVITRLASGRVNTGTGLLRFQVVGNSLKLFLNEQLVAYAFDNALPKAGALGVRLGYLGTLDDFTADAITPQSQTMPFTDDFNSAGATRQLNPVTWQGRVGNYSVVANQARGDGPINLATVRGITTLNTRLRMTVDLQDPRPTVAGDVRYTGLVSRYTGNGTDTNMYWGALVLVDGKVTAEIWRNVKGTWTLLTRQNVDFGSGELEFVTYGQQLRLYLNDQLVAYAHDASLGSGGVGIRGYFLTSLDNFGVENFTKGTATLPYDDNFNQTEGSELSEVWYTRVGNFAARNNQAHGDATINLAVLNGLDQLGDVTGQVALDLTGAGTRFAGVVLRYQGSADRNMYWGALVGVDVRNSQGQVIGRTYTAEIWRNINGVWTVLSRQTVTAGAGTLRFEAFGDSLRLLLGGRVVGFANDTTFRTGSMGIRGYVGTSLDDFRGRNYVPGTPVLPYSDPFTGVEGGPLSNDWYVRAGNFSIRDQLVNGAPVGTRARGDGAINVAVLNGLSPADVAAEADLDLATTGVQFAGLVARHQGLGDRNMYWGALVAVNGTYTAEIWRNVNGSWFKLSSQAVGSGMGRLRFEVVGNRLSLSFAGTAAGEVFDSSFTSGGVGIRGSKDATLDNFLAQ